MKLETLKDLYIHELKDLYSAEKQIIQALPNMVKAATNKQLAAGFQEHLEQTKEHAARLEMILESHDESTRGPKCKGMEGVIEEGDEIIDEDAEEEVRSGLVRRRSALRHYEMASYGCAPVPRRNAASTRARSYFRHSRRRIRYGQKATGWPNP
jgi:ferritin-like metal-binding protein YciE